MDIRLRPHRRPDGTLVLDLGIVFRIFFVAVFVLMVAIRLYAGSLGFVGVLLLVVSLFAALYDERWIFNSESSEVIARIGLLGLARTRRWSYDSIAVIRAVRYWSGTVPRVSRPADDDSGILDRKRFFQRQHVKYELVTRDGEAIRIETRRIHSAEDAWRLPDLVAKAIGTSVERSDS